MIGVLSVDIINNIYKSKLLNDSVYYKIVFMIWALVHTLSFGPRITGYLSPIILLWGVLILFRNLVLKKNILRKSYLYIIFAFLTSYVITIIINKSLNIIGNTKTLIWAAIMLLVIFINEKSENNKKLYNDIIKVSSVIVITTFIISLISVLMFCLDISYWINRIDGALIPQGYYAARLWGIYVDPNQASSIGIVSFISSILILRSKNYSKNYIKIFNIINIIIQYIFIILTGSRGGEIAFIFILIGLVYLLTDYLLKNKIKSIGTRTIIGLLCGCVISITIIISFESTRRLLANIPRLTISTQEYISNTTGNEIGTNSGHITVDRPDVGGGLDSSNGRLTLWRDGFRLIKYSPIFGFGDRNIVFKASQFTPGSSLEKQFVHNGFIHMLLSGGIVAVVIMITLLILIMINIIKVVFGKNRYNKEYYLYSVMSLLVGSLLITAVFLTEIFYQNSFMATVFWIYIGFIVKLGESKKLLEN